MAFFKLRRTSRSQTSVKEVILARDEAGKILHRLSTTEAFEVGEELLNDAKKLVKRFGYEVIEVPEPENSDSGQPVGADVVGQSPTNVPGAAPEGSKAAENQQQAGAQPIAPTTSPQGTPSPATAPTTTSPGPSGPTTTNP